MDLLEYQGKQLFAKHGIAVPSGEVADNGDDVNGGALRKRVEGKLARFTWGNALEQRRRPRQAVRDLAEIRVRGVNHAMRDDAVA